MLAPTSIVLLELELAIARAFLRRLALARATGWYHMTSPAIVQEGVGPILAHACCDPRCWWSAQLHSFEMATKFVLGKEESF